MPAIFTKQAGIATFLSLRLAARTWCSDISEGFGESDGPEQPNTIQGYSDDLFFIASRLGM